MKNTPADSVAFIRDVLLRAGELSLEGFGKSTERSWKGEGIYDFATEYDLRVQEYIQTRIEKEYGDPVLAEEGDTGNPDKTAAMRNAERLWVVDPIDGTFNYRKGIPLYGISVAMCVDRMPAAGGIRFPALGETYLASRGNGVIRESDRDRTSVRLRVTDRLPEEDLLVSVDGRGAPDIIKAIYREDNPNSSFRSWFCATVSLGFLASGREDAYVTTAISPWDCAAGDLIVREAGGFSCDGEGGPVFPKHLDQWLGGNSETFFYVAVTSSRVWEARLRNVLEQCGAASK
ncbi:MAG: inositol monophosphatase family protein [Candidatus Latescibacterota bacterium]